ncbi:MAG: hypothetical protein KAJ96_04915, partial [Candidatus Thorarchaeota archaeon]|nr:hypothetical protein [Candidatus Thorarchaeota archaeon]
RNSKERNPETSKNVQAREQTSETVSESSKEKAEAAERKNAQAESIETHSPRAECEELSEEEVEDTQTEGHLNESDEEEGEVTQDSGSKSMQEWKEDGESEELADSEHLEEPDSTQSTLESYQEVLEENISPDAEELDEDEEVDKQVVSDDEGLTGMLDSPYPTVYVDETGFFAETEEQRWRRKLIELYNELPEEMKQLYRELVKAMLESEEGLEKLLDTFSELREYEDFEEEHEDAIKYVKFRQKIRELKLLGTLEETIAKELALELDIDQETAEKWLNDDYDSFPKIIQQVWSQEIQRRWGNVLRAIANRDVPCDMSEVNEILKRFPELKRKRRFGWHYDEVKAWTEVMAAKRQGRIATLIIQGKERFKVDEVKELAKRFSLTMDKVVRWLRDESRPQLVDVLAEKKQGSPLKPTDSQVENTRGDAPEEDIAPKTLAEFECMLEEHPETRQHRGFQKSYDQILAFYKMKQVAESGELDYLHNQVKWKRLSQRFEVSEYTIKSWFTGQHIPRLIHLLTHLKRKQLSEEIADHRAGRIQSSEKASIESLKGIEELLARHPHLRNQKGFDEKYIRVLLFYEMKMIMNAEPGVRVSEISRKLNLPYNTVRNWIINRTRPQLMTQLLNNEQMRLRHEARLNPKALLNRIDPSLVHDVVRPLGESRQPSIEVAAETLQQLFSESQRSGRVMFLEMQHYNRGGPKWLNRAAQYIKEHLEQIEPLLNSQLAADGSITIRLGFVNNKLYMWKRDANPYSYLNMFADELFYFNEADWTQLIVESQAHLGLKGRVHLSQLIRQISNYGGNNETRVGRYNIDLYSKS